MKMSGNRGNRHADDRKHRGEPPVDLENQFIMRLPEEPAKALRELLQSGAPLKDRLSIKIENNEMRYGEVKFDNWLFHSKVVDLPTIVESLKTIDNKSFYKTADICQMLLCREEDDQTTDDESQIQKKKKDPNKVDKKYLWPHGITPPIKNVRKKRFRKTLRKKYVEAPEIEKEIKRLFQGDAGAVNFKWEVICDEDVSNKASSSSSGAVKIKKDIDENNGGLMENTDVAEHDIFGEPVSDSEDDDDERNINAEIDETSRLSADSRVSDSNSMQVSRYSERSRQDTTTATNTASNCNQFVTEFTRDMFPPDNTNEQENNEALKEPKVENPFHSEYMIPDNYSDAPTISTQRDSLQSRLGTLHAQLADIRLKKQTHENNIANIEHTQLRERFQLKLESLISEELQKMQEIQELEME